MRNCFYPLLLSLLVCISCTTGHEYEGSERFVLDDFVETRQLKGQTLEFDSLIMNPSDLMVIDSFLLVVDSYDEKQIHLYNLNTKKKIAARIFSGQGPKDMIQPMFVDNDKNAKFLILWSITAPPKKVLKLTLFSLKPGEYTFVKLSASISIHCTVAFWVFIAVVYISFIVATFLFTIFFVFSTFSLI